MTNFADSLLEDLMAEHGAELAAGAGPAAASAAPAAGRGRYTRPAWATAGTVAAAGAVVVGFTVFGGTAAAYAVTDNHDGTVTVVVDKPGGIAGANAKLHRLGANAVVMQAHAGCPSILTFAAPQPGGRAQVGMFAAMNSDKATFAVKGGSDSETTLIAFDFEHGHGTIAMVPIKGPVPACVSLPTGPANGAVPGSGSGSGSGSGGSVHTDSGSGSSPALDQQNG